MRKQSHNPTRGMSGRAGSKKKRQKHKPKDDGRPKQLSKAEAERDRAMYNRLADLDIVTRTDWFRNVLSIPAYSKKEAPAERECLEAAERIVRNRGEYCRSCALPVRWKTDLGSDKRARVAKGLVELGKKFKDEAERIDPGNVDNPDSAGGRVLEQVAAGWQKGVYCECPRQSGSRQAAD